MSTVSDQSSAFETELKDFSSASMSADVENWPPERAESHHSSLEASKEIESTMRDVLFFMKERVSEGHSSERKLNRVQTGCLACHLFK